MAAITRVAAMMIDHLFVAILSDLPAESIFAIGGKRWLVTRARSVTGVHGANEFGRENLFPAKFAVVHVQVEPPPQIRNAREDSASRLHVLVRLFELAAHHLARVDCVSVDYIRRRNLVLPGARPGNI